MPASFAKMDASAETTPGRDPPRHQERSEPALEPSGKAMLVGSNTDLSDPSTASGLNLPSSGDVSFFVCGCL